MSLRAQRMATTAFERVSARATLTTETSRKYGALAHKLPGMILQSGLAQATGFLLAKAQGGDADPHTLLLDDLHAVLNANRPLGTTTATELHALVLRAPLLETLALTRAALEASSWIKRYVQGVLRVSTTGDSEAGTEGPAEGSR